MNKKKRKKENEDNEDQINTKHTAIVRLGQDAKKQQESGLLPKEMRKQLEDLIHLAASSCKTFILIG